MKDIYELLNDIDIDETEFKEMEVTELEKAKVKRTLKKSLSTKKKNETLAKECYGCFYYIRVIHRNDWILVYRFC
ncbi:hypothetical protein Q5O89_21650 [Peribacillus frigoritolerans]|nr:hypothetical protein [Peribacillus frigoritolerans]